MICIMKPKESLLMASAASSLSQPWGRLCAIMCVTVRVPVWVPSRCNSSHRKIIEPGVVSGEHEVRSVRSRLSQRK
jgi:hypothetical protein